MSNFHKAGLKAMKRYMLEEEGMPGITVEIVQEIYNAYEQAFWKSVDSLLKRKEKRLKEKGID